MASPKREHILLVSDNIPLPREQHYNYCIPGQLNSPPGSYKHVINSLDISSPSTISQQSLIPLVFSQNKSATHSQIGLGLDSLLTLGKTASLCSFFRLHWLEHKQCPCSSENLAGAFQQNHTQNNLDIPSPSTISQLLTTFASPESSNCIPGQLNSPPSSDKHLISVWISYKVPVLSLQTVKSKEQLLTLPTHEAYDQSITSPKFSQLRVMIMSQSIDLAGLAHRKNSLTLNCFLT